MNLVDTLAIAFKVETEDLDKGIKTVKDKIDDLADSIGKSLGNGAKKLKDIFVNIFDFIRNFASKSVAALAGALGVGFTAWIFAFSQQFGKMKEEVKALNELSKKVNGDVEDISAWGNAIEANGGSAKAFQHTLIALTNDMRNLSLTGKSKNKPLLEMLGINTDNVSGKPVFDLISEITKSVEGMDKGQSRDILTKLGFDSDTIELIQSGSKNIEEIVKQQKEWGVYTKKDTEAIEKMDKAIKQMSLALKSTFLPLFSRVVSTMSKVTVYVSKAAIWLRNNLDIVRKAVLLLAVALFDKLLLALHAVGKAAMAHPLLLLVAGLTMLLLLLEDLWTYANNGESAFEGLWEKLGTPKEIMEGFKKVEDFFKSVGDVIDSVDAGFAKFLLITTLLTKAFIALKVILAGTFAFIAGIPAAAIAIIAGLIAFIYTYKDELIEAFTAVGKIILSFFTEVIPKAFQEVWNAADKTVDEAIDYLKGKWKELTDSFKIPVFDSIKMPEFKSLDLGIFEKIEEVVSSVSTAIKTLVTSIWDITTAVFVGILGFIGDILISIFDKISSAFVSVCDTIRSAFQSAIDFVVETAESGFQFIVGIVSGLWDTIISMTQTEIDIVATIWNAFVAIVQVELDIIADLWNGLVSAFETGSSSIGNFLSNAANVARRAWEGFITWLEEKWQWLKDLLPSFASIANKLPSLGNSPQMAMAGAGGNVSNTTTTDNSNNNYTFNNYTRQAAEASMEKAGLMSSQANSGVTP